MKRNYCLVFVSLFALTGCASKISVADAKTRASEIRQHEIADDEVKEIKITSASTMTLKAKTSFLTLDMTATSDALYEVSAEKNFIHSRTKSEGAMYGSSAGEYETWFYVKDNVFYNVSRQVKGETETAEYTKVEGNDAAVAAFSNSLKEMVSEIKSGMAYASKDSLDIVDALSENGEAEMELYEGVKAKGTLTPYSSGEGSLIIKGSLSLDKFAGIEGKAKSSVLLSWDKNLINEATIKFDWSGKKDDETGSISILNSQKVAGKAKVSYPDLSKYTAK